MKKAPLINRSNKFAKYSILICIIRLSCIVCLVFQFYHSECTIETLIRYTVYSVHAFVTFCKWHNDVYRNLFSIYIISLRISREAEEAIIRNKTGLLSNKIITQTSPIQMIMRQEILMKKRQERQSYLFCGTKKDVTPKKNKMCQRLDGAIQTKRMDTIRVMYFSGLCIGLSDLNPSSRRATQCIGFSFGSSTILRTRHYDFNAPYFINIHILCAIGYAVTTTKKSANVKQHKTF